MRVVTAARLALPGDGLAARIDAAHVRTHRAAKSFRIARAIRVYVLIIVHLLGCNSSCRAVGVWRQGKWNTVAPPPADLRGQQFGIDLVFIRLQEIFESDDVGLDHLENSKAAVQAKFSRLRQDVILSLFLQDEQPGLAGLLVIRVIFFRAATEGGLTDAVSVFELNSVPRHG